MQGLSLDFELATGTATMLGLYASYKWQMGFFDLFSKISSAACSLIRVLLSVLPSLIFNAAV